MDSYDKSIPLISVIVPIYNVEKYLRKCLDSLKNQTLKQIEVICIDDGSTDRSGEIADEYRSIRWPKFKVVHTDNRGLSAARNRGLNEAVADWIMFVDSDDWVDMNICKVPYEKSIEYGADIVCFKSYIVTRFGHIKKPKKTNTPTGIVDEMIAHDFGGTVTWNKLYRKSLFYEIRYPEGRVFEDIATTHKLVHAAESILMNDECLYYHQMRYSNIGHIHNLKNNRDRFVAILGKSMDFKSYGCSEKEVQSKD